jgi:hypothetical protein
MELETNEIDAVNLLHWNRFDVLFKYLYGLARKRRWDTNYYTEMYRHHLKIWNGFTEYDDPNKNSFESYESDFCHLLDDIESHGFDKDKSLVAIQDSKFLLNGGHRVAACLVHSERVGFFEGADVRDGQLDCSWQFFKSLIRRGRLRREYADRAALEYARLKPNTRVVVLYPSATRFGRIKDVRRILEGNSKIIYEKSIDISSTGAINLMRELYFKEEWAERKRGAGYAAKAKFCYQSSGFFRRMAPTHIFLMELETKEKADSLKDEIRAIYQIQKHSAHINDTHEETVRLCKCFFNDNSIHFLNHFNRKFFSRFEGLLSEFIEWIEASGLEPEDYCISAGSVLSAYGIKECKDIDYLHSNPKELVGNKLIQSHNAYGLGLYHTNVDDVVHNPRNHFYRYGVKFSTLSVVEKLKKKRGERKDFRDLKRIKKIT